MKVPSGSVNKIRTGNVAFSLAYHSVAAVSSGPTTRLTGVANQVPAGVTTVSGEPICMRQSARPLAPVTGTKKVCCPDCLASAIHFGQRKKQADPILHVGLPRRSAGFGVAHLFGCWVEHGFADTLTVINESTGLWIAIHQQARAGLLAIEDKQEGHLPSGRIMRRIALPGEGRLGVVVDTALFAADCVVQ